MQKQISIGIVYCDVMNYFPLLYSNLSEYLFQCIFNKFILNLFKQHKYLDGAVSQLIPSQQSNT